MKITLKRLREIVIEEVIKEEVSPEDAQRTIIALLQGTPPNVTGDIMGAVYDEMYDTDVSEPTPEPEEEFPTDYQAGGAYGDRPTMGFKESLAEIIQKEIQAFLNEELDEITSRTKAIARMRGVPHMGSGPLPRPEPASEQDLEGASDLDFENMEDHELVTQAHQDGIEDFITLDYEGELVNREEIIAALLDIGNRIDENLPPREEIGALRRQIGDMSYEIERMLVALMKAGYSMEDIMQMASELRKMDPHPADVQVAERKLSKAEEKEKEKVVKGMKKSKKDFEKRYGDDAESVMYATATKMAKEKKD